MRAEWRCLIGLLLCVAIFFSGVALLSRGVYGWTIFAVLPFLAGAIAAWAFQPRTYSRAAAIGGALAIAGTVLFLIAGLDGAVCVLMCLPLVAPFGAIGGWVAMIAIRRAVNGEHAVMLMFLPLATLTFDVTAHPIIFKVHSEVIVSAMPEQVWKHVVTFSELAEPDEWFFRAGLAYPKRARIVGAGPGAIRYCEFSTGPFVEPIVTWDEPRLLAFNVTQNPAPMNEWSPYKNVLPKHLHGYFISKHGEFRLTPLSGGRTRLEGTTWYQHGLWPGQYWRWWSDAIIHRIHLRVLNHVKTLAEADRG